MAELADAQDSGSCFRLEGAGSSPVIRTKRDPVEPVMVRLGYIFTFFSGSSLVNKPNETRTRPRKMSIIKHFGRSDKIETP